MNTQYIINIDLDGEEWQLKDWADTGREKQIRLLREIDEKTITKMLTTFSQSDEISAFSLLILCFFILFTF